MFNNKSKEIKELKFQISTLHDCINTILKQCNKSILEIREQSEKEWLAIYEENEKLKNKYEIFIKDI